MKWCCPLLMLFVAVEASAVTVSLTTNVGQFASFSTPLTLQTTVTATPPPPETPFRGIRLSLKPVYGYAFTYTAQQTSPCQQTITIAGNGPTTTWTPPNPGTYALNVAVVETMKMTNGTETTARTTASAPLTVTRNGPPVVVNLGGSGPNVTFSAKLQPPTTGALHYHFVVRAMSGGAVGSISQPVVVGASDGNQPSYSGAFNWNFNGAAVHVDVNVTTLDAANCMVFTSVGAADRAP